MYKIFGVERGYIYLIFLIWHMTTIILFWEKNVLYDVLHDLVTFVQLKKHEKYPRRSVTFSKVAGFSIKFY